MMSMLPVLVLAVVGEVSNLALTNTTSTPLPPPIIGSGTCTATSVAWSNVDWACNVCATGSGMIVVIPSGTNTWTNTLSLTKGVTILGATTITGATSNPVVVDATVIVDGITKSGTQSYLISANVASGQVLRVSGLTFSKGNTNISNRAGVRIDGASQSVRIDHCHFDKLYQDDYIHSYGWLYGVIDHCVFDMQPSSRCMTVWHSTWGGAIWGQGSWSDATQFGSEKFLFFEDNTVNGYGVLQSGNIDCKNGGRYVARHNVFNNSTPMSHGTENTKQTGTRAVEIYGNTFNFSAVRMTSLLRSGVAVTYSNTWTGIQPDSILELAAYREMNAFSGTWGGASGKNAWDSNDVAGVYASGVHTGTNGQTRLVTTGTTWTNNQWIGFVIVNTNSGLNSYVTASTSNSVTYKLYTPPYFSWSNGDFFEIRKVVVALDQAGRGRRDVIATDGTGTPVNPAAWPNQLLEPCYSWSNTYSGAQMDMGSPYPTIQENRDYYNRTAMPGYTPYVYPHPLNQ